VLGGCCGCGKRDGKGDVPAGNVGGIVGAVEETAFEDGVFIRGGFWEGSCGGKKCQVRQEGDGEGGNTHHGAFFQRNAEQL